MTKKKDISGWIFEVIRILKIRANIFLFNKPIRLYCRIRGVKVGKGTVFNGIPKINRVPYSSITIGEGGKFNSARNSVMLLLIQRCTFSTLMKGAEISIGNNTGATGVTIIASSKVTIGNNVLLGAYSTIFDNDFHHADPKKRDEYHYPSRPVVIEDNVFIGKSTLILKGVRIGENSVIGAHSVVMKDIPPNSIAMGNPCKVLIKRNWNNPAQEE